MLLCAGIGKSIAKKLAAQQLNVVLVALQDSTLDATHAELRAAFPNVTFRKVNADVGESMRRRVHLGTKWRLHQVCSRRAQMKLISCRTSICARSTMCFALARRWA